MEERKLNIIFNKSGSGSTNTKVSLPITWIKQMGITQNNREVVAIYDEEKQEITIKKQK
ncbi:MAG: AbrB/MazE/SpoVT family DNA-binding domain-containing protein [Clostridia bacterium]|nr:AbrB/MazE/SpoVT family DNA-binding domain-containing protein [Clostridia bacterium]